MIRIIMDSQVLTTLQICEVMLDLRFNHNLVPISGMGRPIEMGSMMHRMLEPYYLAKRKGKNRNDAAAIAIQYGNLVITGCEACIKKECKEHKDPYMGLQATSPEESHYVMDTFLQYHEFWKNDSWTTLNVETVKGKVIYEDDELSLMWKAKIDWEVDNLEGIFSVDHKTMSRREDTLSLNNQFIGQCVVTNQTKMFENKIGWQKTLKPNEKFERVALNYSKERIAEWIIETASYAYDLAALQEGKRYRHKFTSCSRKYGPCIFRKVCEGQPVDRERLLKEQFKVAERVWDVPLDDTP